MRYKYHTVNIYETVPYLLQYYNISLDVLIQLNKCRYPHLITNPYMIFEGNILLIPTKESFEEE